MFLEFNFVLNLHNETIHSKNRKGFTKLDRILTLLWDYITQSVFGLVKCLDCYKGNEALNSSALTLQLE